MLLFKEGLSLIIKRLSFNSNTRFLFSLASTRKLSKDGEWLQSNKWSMAELRLGFTFFLVRFWYAPQFFLVRFWRAPQFLH